MNYRRNLSYNRQLPNSQSSYHPTPSAATYPTQYPVQRPVQRLFAPAARQPHYQPTLEQSSTSRPVNWQDKVLPGPKYEIAEPSVPAPVSMPAVPIEVHQPYTPLQPVEVLAEPYKPTVPVTQHDPYRMLEEYSTPAPALPTISTQSSLVPFPEVSPLSLSAKPVSHRIPIVDPNTKEEIVLETKAKPVVKEVVISDAVELSPLEVFELPPTNTTSEAVSVEEPTYYVPPYRLDSLEDLEGISGSFSVPNSTNSFSEDEGYHTTTTAPSAEPATYPTRRVYSLDFLLSKSGCSTPPASLALTEIYLPHPVGPVSILGSTESLGSSTSVPPSSTTPGTAKVSPKQELADWRSQSLPKYEAEPVFLPMPERNTNLPHQAEVAFNIKNARKVSCEEERLKRVRGILNRITREKYTQLFEKLWEQIVDEQGSMVGLERVLDTVFDVALDQPGNCNLYADVCQDLRVRIQQHQKEEEGQQQGATLKEFRRILLNRCQSRFEESFKRTPTEMAPELTPEEVETRTRQENQFRRRTIGNIRFISELFKRSLLSERVLHYVIRVLLEADHSDSKHADLLEVLCVLLKAVGCSLDRADAKHYFDVYFTRLEKISTSHVVSRTRFLVLEVVELRKSNWVDRFETKDKDMKPEGKPQVQLPPQPSQPQLQQLQLLNSPIRTPVSEISPAASPPSGVTSPLTVDRASRTPVKRVWKELPTQPQLDPTAIINNATSPILTLSSFGAGSVGSRRLSSSTATTPTTLLSSQQNVPAEDERSLGSCSSDASGPSSSFYPGAYTPKASQIVEVVPPQQPQLKTIQTPPSWSEHIALRLLDSWVSQDRKDVFETFSSEVSMEYHLQLLSGLINAAVDNDNRYLYSSVVPEIFHFLLSLSVVSIDIFQNAVLRAIQKCFLKHRWEPSSLLWQSYADLLFGLTQVSIINFDTMLKVCEVLLSDSYDLEHCTRVFSFLESTIYRLQSSENFRHMMDREKINRLRTLFTRRFQYSSNSNGNNGGNYNNSNNSNYYHHSHSHSSTPTAGGSGSGASSRYPQNDSIVKLNHLVSLLHKVDCRA